MEFDDLFKMDLKDIPFITPKEFFQMMKEFRQTVEPACLFKLCGNIDNDCHIKYNKKLDIRLSAANHRIKCDDLQKI